MIFLPSCICHQSSPDLSAQVHLTVEGPFQTLTGTKECLLFLLSLKSCPVAVVLTLEAFGSSGRNHVLAPTRRLWSVRSHYYAEEVRSQVVAAEERLKEVFSPGGENDEVAVTQSHLLWILMEIRCMREFQPSDVGFGLPHNKNLSTQVLVSPSRDSRTMRLVLRWPRLLISSAAPPHPPLLCLMNISWNRSDSPPPALRSYSQTRTELSLPIAFR